MKILYGIQLNGNGHITRSIELIDKLKSVGYEVDVVTSGSNSNLELPFEHKLHVLSHFHFQYKSQFL
jgi:UDP:flavonoid glycosyltransferase YjiC (YdhE family)